MTYNHNSPFFIVGVHRSGTTLLRYILSSHSRLYIPQESDFIPYFFGKKPHEILTEQRISELVNNIFTHYRFVEDWKGPAPDIPTLMHLMRDKTPAGFLDAIYSIYAQQNNAIRWGDKTPIYASYIGLIHEIFPNAKFIHIIRDPFDAAISLIEKYQRDEFHIDPYFAARNWVGRIQAIIDSQKGLQPHLFFELRYEDLTRNPENEIRRICDFLGEKFESSMLEQHKLARQEIPSDSHFFSNVRQPVFTNSIGRGRKLLSVADKRLIQKVTAALMTKFDYPLEDVGVMSLPEKLRWFFLWFKFVTLQTGRRAATILGLMPPI